MSSESQLTTFSDIYTDLLNALRIDTSQTSTVTQCKRAVNKAIHDIHVGRTEKFPWCERRATLITQPEYTTGTVAISKGSTSLVGTSTAWATANDFSANNMRVGGKIVIDGKEEVYEITAVGSDTTATLGSSFIETTVTAATYVYFEDEYALASDFFRPFDMQYFDEAHSIELIGRREFRMRYPRNRTTGKPLIASIFDKNFASNTTPVRKIAFWKPPSAAVLLPYNYLTNQLGVDSSGTGLTSLSSDDDEPTMPIQYRHVIVLRALFTWYRDKKNDTRSQEALAEYQDVLSRMIGDTEIGSSRPQFRPRVAAYKSHAARPYRTRGSRFVTGSRFDELR